jgi:2-polyprenyl-3-methyl-5-hydroxy-6-metoxy-1,4-benzoquinol methylase
MKQARCRFCGHPLALSLIDLGMSPLSNRYVDEQELNQAEKFYPLHVFVCSNCFLVQLELFESPEVIFGDYAYFSSYSDSWLSHMQAFANSAIERFELDERKTVIEIASNDGYLLQYFVQRKIPALGIEPAANVAKVAEAKGIATLVAFFGTQTARGLIAQGKKADLLIGNNVLAHVPDINDFVQGMQLLLKPEGVITMEFPHFLRLFENGLFDTIYHEHFSYLSLMTVEKVFARFGLAIFDVQEIPTHGGSLRIYARHAANSKLSTTDNVLRVKNQEQNLHLDIISTYAAFAPRVQKIKRDILSFLLDAQRNGKLAAGYGAPAKGNTFLNYCGIRTDLLSFTVDRNPFKQGKFLPGSHIPIFSPDQIRQTKPDYLLILPWNLKDEIMVQMAHIREWGGKFVVALPKVEFF